MSLWLRRSRDWQSDFHRVLCWKAYPTLDMPEIPPVRRPTAEEKEDAEHDFMVQMHIIKEHQQSVKAGLDEALATITTAIRQHWSTGGGTRLRQIVWSVWNGETFIGLYDVLGGLDYDLGRAVAKLLEAQLVGALDSDDYLRRVLTESGEFARYDEAARDTPEGEEVIYPPLPIYAERKRKLAEAAASKESRPEAGDRAEDERFASTKETHS